MIGLATQVFFTGSRLTCVNLPFAPLAYVLDAQYELTNIDFALKLSKLHDIWPTTDRPARQFALSLVTNLTRREKITGFEVLLHISHQFILLDEDPGCT